MSFIKSTKIFLSEKFNLFLVIFLILLGCFAYFKDFDFSKKTNLNDEIEVHFFYLPTCPHCNEQKPIYYEIKNEFKKDNNIKFFEHDASTSESALFYKMASEAGLDTKKLAVPTIFVNNKFGKNALVGVQSKENLLNALNECINQCKDEKYRNKPKQDLNEIDEKSLKNFDLPFLGKTDLTKYSLLSLSVILGLIDGFNPCAMWVLVYLIGILIELNDKKKIWLIVGSFVFASGFLYFLFMTAWLNVFLLLGYIKLITIIIGMIALGGGILNLKEYITTKELVCKVGDLKEHKKTMKKIDKIALQPITIGLILSIIGLAFVVNSVEFMCSAAIPAVFTQILALSNISTLMNYFYIAIYTFFFMLDDLIIFGMAAFAINTSFGEKYAKYTKLIGAIIMTILGLILLFMPQILR
ncbi:MAG: thioredoxin domain-containing protein [Candidatus Woesearchaeota archaeon]